MHSKLIIQPFWGLGIFTHFVMRTCKLCWKTSLAHFGSFALIPIAQDQTHLEISGVLKPDKTAFLIYCIFGLNTFLSAIPRECFAPRICRQICIQIADFKSWCETLSVFGPICKTLKSERRVTNIWLLLTLPIWTILVLLMHTKPKSTSWPDFLAYKSSEMFKLEV